MVEAAATTGTRQRRAEEEASRVVLDELDDVAPAEEDAADAAERLREGRDEDRHAIAETGLLEDAGAARAERAGAVSVVHDEHGVVRASQISTNSLMFALSPSSE